MIYHRQGVLPQPPLWQLLVAFVAVLALSSGAGAREGVRLLGLRRLALLAGIGALLVGDQALNSWAQPVPHLLGLLRSTIGVTGLLLAAGVAVMWRLDRSVRRRLLSVLAPLATLSVVTGLVALVTTSSALGPGYLVLRSATLVGLTVLVIGVTSYRVGRSERRATRLTRACPRRLATACTTSSLSAVSTVNEIERAS